MTPEKLAWVKDLKEVRRGRISAYADEFKSATFDPSVSTYHEGKKPVWTFECRGGPSRAPPRTRSTIAEAQALVDRTGCKVVAEGANMPSSTPEAVRRLPGRRLVLYAPGKAANAGGVAVSALEMAQNSMRQRWSAQEVESKLKGVMANIHRQCVEAATTYSTPDDLIAGANIAGYVRVANAMREQGLV